MKKTTGLTVAALFFMTVASCTSTSPIEDVEKQKDHYVESCTRSLEEALQIASVTLNQSRQPIERSSNVSYITTERNPYASRSQNYAEISDTLAYIVNQPDENGFAIVSYDKRVKPILAFSNSGNFQVPEDENHFINEYFVNLLPEYVENSILQTGLIGGGIKYDVMYIVPPIIEFRGWDQYGDFATYIDIEHPKSPVGCMALTYTRIGLMVTDSITWKKEQFDIKAIRESLTDYANLESDNSDLDDNDKLLIEQKYNDAIDRVAKLLYYFDEDYAIFEPESTKMPQYKGKARYCQMFESFIYPSVYNDSEYNSEEILEKILSGSIISMAGNSSHGGHSWIVDGAAYSRADPKLGLDTRYSDILLKCDWGWNELFNGFYSGDVFELYLSEDKEPEVYQNMSYSYTVPIVKRSPIL